MPRPMNSVRFHAAKDLRLEQIERPGRPGAGEVLVRVEAAGICGSDLHVYETGAYVTKIPVVSGHEFAGVALQVGDEVTGIKVGDHVVADSRVYCGSCDFCRRGLTNLCRNLGFIGEVRDGAFAEEIILSESALVKIAPEVPFHLAALAEPLAVALHALKQARGGPAMKTIVLGAGPVGALIHLVAEIREFENIHIADVSEYRRAAINRAIPEAAVAEFDAPYDLVFEATGSDKVMAEMVPALTNKMATVVMVGIFRRETTFQFNHLVENEWTVKGCAAFSDELPEAARLLEDHWQRFEHIVSHRIPLRDFQQAFDLLLSSEKKAMKIVLLPGKLS